MILALAGLVACEGDPASPHPRVELEDRWGGDFRPAQGPIFSEVDSRIEIQIDALEGTRITGTATLNREPYTLTGSYRPPVIFLELRAQRWATLRFVGEITSRNVMDGTLTVDAPEPLTASLILFRR